MSTETKHEILPENYVETPLSENAKKLYPEGFELNEAGNDLAAVTINGRTFRQLQTARITPEARQRLINVYGSEFVIQGFLLYQAENCIQLALPSPDSNPPFLVSANEVI